MRSPHLIRLWFALLFCSSLVAGNLPQQDIYQRADALYRHGRGDSHDAAEALQLFLVAAEAGHPSAQFYAGRMYQLGHGTERSLSRAVDWYRLAGQNGQARAWNNLANVYIDAPELAPEPLAFLHCYEQASQLGMAMGSNNLAKIYHNGKHGIEADYSRALHYYMTSLKQYPNYPGVWNNVGRLYEKGGPGLKRNLKLAERAYQKGVDLEDADALYNLADLYYDEELDAEADEIVNLLERAAKLGHVQAQFRLGWIHESGRYGVRAYYKAIAYYEKAAEQGHGTALNNLAMLLIKSRRETENSPRVIELLEAAAALNNQYALNNLGYRHVYQKFPEADPRTGIDLLIRSAGLGYREAILNLGKMAQNSELRPYFTPTELAHWAQAEVDLKKVARQSANDALEAADAWIRSQDYAAALAVIDEHFAAYTQLKSKDSYSFLSRIWWDAQTQRGRSDPEWSWRLFDWCRRQYDKELYHLADNRMTVRRNQIAGLTEVGRLGLVRESCEGLRTLLNEIYGLTFDFDSVLAGIDTTGAIPAETQFDLKVSPAMAKQASWNTLPGSILTNSAAHSLVALGDERLYAGDWQAALYFSRWVELWAEEVLASGEVPKNNPRGWVEETLQDSLLLRARTYELLGDLPAAIAVYEIIIHDGRRPYKGRLTDTATLEATVLRSRLGESPAISIAELEALEVKQRANHFDFGQAGEENQLARAWQYHARGEPAAAHQLLEGVLAFTEQNEPHFFESRP
ncbi:tetratricopeptide repeat protein [Coraliomargarita sp. SDUM461004]|uniref:Tetratricopeptide repeat protein n=1 Tax=Thalassobacterium sedimentorum TaxID=3041258 RepID=A0ABU1AKS9_9BACT|nr:tetratricopeptide repeat protein [Coraliomargarita sp. SDUM461004]MDQ8195414.1 tetratricopeptide repeat protein [Coraliomargarita sp. SDUM461004]